jgi:hypothetical protein
LDKLQWLLAWCRDCCSHLASQQKEEAKKIIEEEHKLRWNPVMCRLDKPKEGRKGYAAAVLDRFMQMWPGVFDKKLINSDVDQLKKKFWKGELVAGRECELGACGGQMIVCCFAIHRCKPSLENHQPPYLLLLLRHCRREVPS